MRASPQAAQLRQHGEKLGTAVFEGLASCKTLAISSILCASGLAQL